MPNISLILPRFSTRLATLQAGVTGAGTVFPVPFDTPLADSHTALQGGVFVAPDAGEYVFGAAVELTSLVQVLDEARLVLRINGADHFESRMGLVADLGGWMIQGQWLATLNAADQVDVTTQVTGGIIDTVNVAGAMTPPWRTVFWGHMVAPA